MPGLLQDWGIKNYKMFEGSIEDQRSMLYKAKAGDIFLTRPDWDSKGKETSAKDPEVGMCYFVQRKANCQDAHEHDIGRAFRFNDKGKLFAFKPHETVDQQKLQTLREKLQTSRKTLPECKYQFKSSSWGTFLNQSK